MKSQETWLLFDPQTKQPSETEENRILGMYKENSNFFYCQKWDCHVGVYDALIIASYTQRGFPESVTFER